MKKSNKLLLGGFLTGLFLISAIHIALYAKYKNGNYTVYSADHMRANSMQLFPNILFVSLHNLPEATVRFSDVAGVDKTEAEGLQYVQKGDTLQIWGKGKEHGEIWDPIAFDLPYNATLSLHNSFITFRQGKKENNNPVIYLRKSQAFFMGVHNPFRLGNVKIIAADSSMAVFNGNNQVNSLDVQLTNSSIDYNEGNVGQLSILTDSASRIGLQYRHLLKAKITTTQ
jgi:hypothetical protein